VPGFWKYPASTVTYLIFEAGLVSLLCQLDRLGTSSSMTLSRTLADPSILVMLKL
jgi:hypothetical protein